MIPNAVLLVRIGPGLSVFLMLPSHLRTAKMVNEVIIIQ